MIIKSKKLRNQKAIKFKNITFQAVDWANSDVFVDREDDDSDADSDNGYKKYKKRDKLLQIRVYGLTKSGVSVCCLIEGFKPFFYIKLPNTWTPSYLKAFSKKLRKKLGKKVDGLVSIQKIKRKEYYGFTNEVYQSYVEIIFNNMAAYYEAKRIIRGKNDFDEDEEDKPMFISIGGKKINISEEVVMYETNISPLLRFFHDKDIKPAGWLKVSMKKYKEVKYHTSCQINIKCSWEDIVPVDKNDIAPMMVASFDLECTSDDGSFPNPFKDTDEIIQIGTTIHRYGEKECCYKRIDTLKICNDIEGSEVVCYRRERDMILGWAKFIKDIGPEIITGYNIWGFDMKYIYDRANKYGFYKDLKLMLSKINDQPTWDTDYVKGAKWKEKKLASSALGDNFLKYFEIEGMIGIDLFKLIQKDHNLNSYKLDNVSKVFIRGNITKYESCDNGMKLHTNNIDALTVEQWVSIEFKTKRKNLIGDHRKKYKVIELNIDEKWFIVESFKFDGLFIDECMEDAIQGDIKSIWFQNKNDLPPTTLFEYYKDGAPDKITEIAKYCIKDCELCNLLIIKLDVITANIGQANVCIVPFSYLFLRGQGVKIFSLVAKQCRLEKYMVKTVRKEDVDSSGYEGAIVFKPNSGIYFEPVAVMDYASLYPSSMIAENISHDTLLMIKEYNNEGELISETGDKSLMGLDDYNYNDIEYDVYEGVGDDKKKVGYKVCTFVEKKSGEKGVLPRILMKLLKARKDTRKMIKYKVIKSKSGDEFFGLLKEKDDHYEIAEVNKEKNIVSKDDMVKIYDKYNDFEKMMLDALQKAYKVVCNSLYGQVGATTSPMCLKALAACTTATGRKMVTVARDITLEKYEGSRLVYGDTDSVFISFKDYLLKKHGEMSDEELLKKTIDAGIEAGALITNQLKRPQELEYEKTFYPFIIFSKKRYVGNKYEFNTKKYKQTSMGIVLKRRDNAPIVKEIYGGVIDMILNKRNIDAAKEYFKKDVKKLLKGDVDIYSLIISKSIRAMYANPTQIAHKVLADRMGDRDPGNKPKSNDRIPYCYIDKSALICKICNAKITPKNCKCVRCMNIYCNKHLFTHRKTCLIRCRYYKRTNEEEKEYQLSNAKKASEKKAINKRDINSFIKMCKTCHGWYSDEAMILHNIRTDKYGRKHHDKCKKKLTNKLLQGDIIEHPDFIIANNLKMDYRYYLEHQIEKPVMQIFGLTMDNPKKLIEDILVDDDHRKNGTSSITNWFKKVKSI
jgi:DNA polymerase elongation subunit (family B)